MDINATSVTDNIPPALPDSGSNWTALCTAISSDIPDKIIPSAVAILAPTTNDDEGPTPDLVDRYGTIVAKNYDDDKTQNLVHRYGIIVSKAPPLLGHIKAKVIPGAADISVYCDDTIVHDPPDYSLLGQHFIGDLHCRADLLRLSKMHIIVNGETRLPDALASVAGAAPTILPQSDSDTDDGRCPGFPKQRLTDYAPANYVRGELRAANYKRKRLRAVVTTTRHNAGGRPPSHLRVYLDSGAIRVQ
jgi:hypothetical protein